MIRFFLCLSLSRDLLRPRSGRVSDGEFVPAAFHWHFVLSAVRKLSASKVVVGGGECDHNLFKSKCVVLDGTLTST